MSVKARYRLGRLGPSTLAAKKTSAAYRSGRRDETAVCRGGRVCAVCIGEPYAGRWTPEVPLLSDGRIANSGTFYRDLGASLSRLRVQSRPQRALRRRISRDLGNATSALRRIRHHDQTQVRRIGHEQNLEHPFSVRKGHLSDGILLPPPHAIGKDWGRPT